jgi:two-component system sensor histidine kinase KdpD
MTRLESGAVTPNHAPHDLGEIVGSALQRAGRVLAGRHADVDLAPDLPMVEVDPVLMEQVLFNLLDNAAKHAPEDTGISIRGRHDASGVVLEIADEGEGIPPDQTERIFDKFHRAQKGDSVRAGTGLGLAICRGFVEAMGGTIVAANRADGPGAVFTVTLPAAASLAEGHAA